MKHRTLNAIAVAVGIVISVSCGAILFGLIWLVERFTNWPAGVGLAIGLVASGVFTWIALVAAGYQLLIRSLPPGQQNRYQLIIWQYHLLVRIIGRRLRPAQRAPAPSRTPRMARRGPQTPRKTHRKDQRP